MQTCCDQLLNHLTNTEITILRNFILKMVSGRASNAIDQRFSQHSVISTRGLNTFVLSLDVIHGTDLMI